MTRAFVSLLMACAVAHLVGCASRPQGPPQDETLARLVRAGASAYDLERPDEAATQYRAALTRARARDDAGAIADAGFNLAAAELRAGKSQAAMATAQEVEAELARRGHADHGFDLIIATALYRMGNLAGADRIASVLATNSDRQIADSAWFLRGLIADERGDRAVLQAAVASVSPTADPADVTELRARLDRDPALALKAVDLRRTALDYRGMARALALAAQLTSDPNAAAELYLRAGRSAAAQGDATLGRTWLAKARDLARDPALRAAASRGP